MPEEPKREKTPLLPPLASLRGTILPGEPPIGQCGAHALLEDALGRKLEVEFYSTNEDPTPGQRQEWYEAGFAPIDIGQSYRYHSRKLGSAIEGVAFDYGLQLDPVQQALVATLAENHLTGGLKDSPHAIAWICREAYKDGQDPSLVTRRTVDAVRTHLAAERLGGVDRVESSDLTVDPSWVNPYSGKLFTVGRLVRQMVVLGRRRDAIEEAKYWILAERTAHEAIAQARAEVVDIVRDDFRTTRNYLGCHIDVRGKSQRLTRVLFETFGQYRVVVTESDSGVAILTKGIKADLMQPLADILCRAEPNRWFFDARICALLNGTRSYSEVPRTSMSTPELVEFICAYM